MKKLIIFLLLILMACAPVAPPAKEMKAPQGQPEAKVLAREEVTAPAQPKPPQPVEVTVPGTPLEPTGHKIDPYSQLGCEQLLTADEFAKACGNETANLVVTYKIGTKNCFVNIKSRQDERLTAGITVTGFKDSAAATTEFERRLKVLQVGADKSVGERAFTSPFAMVNRETLTFLRSEFIVEVGADTHLCSKEGLLPVAQTVDSRLK